MLIGINGFKGAGKNTVGSYLVDTYGFEEHSFAKLMKESAAALFGIESHLWENWKNNPEAKVTISSPNTSQLGPSGMKIDRASVTVREFLQRYGTEAHRTIFGSDFWVDYALEGINESKDIVFTDARFENELQRIKSLGGYNLQVLRPSVFTKDSHASEVPPPQHLIDFAIDNNGSLNDLYNKVDDFMAQVDSEFVVGGMYGDWRDNPGNYGE